MNLRKPQKSLFFVVLLFLFGSLPRYPGQRAKRKVSFRGCLKSIVLPNNEMKVT